MNNRDLLEDAIGIVNEVAYDRDTPESYNELFYRAGLDPAWTRIVMQTQQRFAVNTLMNKEKKDLPTTVLAHAMNMFFVGVEYERRRWQQEVEGDPDDDDF